MRGSFGSKHCGQLGFVALATATQIASAQGDPTAAGVAYRIAGMDSVDVATDIVYKRVPTANGSRGPADLALDVYTSKRAAGNTRLPAIIFVHGGVIPGQGPMPKVWGVYRSWGRLAAAAGYTGITFNHRATIVDNVDESGSDVLDLIAVVRSHSTQLHVDPERLCLIFYSAGGPASSVILRAPRRTFGV